MWVFLFENPEKSWIDAPSPHLRRILGPPLERTVTELMFSLEPYDLICGC